MTNRFEEALVFATKLHQEQRRKGSGVPYISHLLSVTALVIEQGGDEDEAIAALLHDAIEDQGGPRAREQIRSRFGDHVTEIVDGCTDSETSPKPPWKGRKLAYIAHLGGASASIRLVSAADKLHSARTILNDYRTMGDEIWERFAGRKEGTLWYYRSVLDVLSQAGRTPLIEELDRVVSQLEQLTERHSVGGGQASGNSSADQVPSTD